MNYNYTKTIDSPRLQSEIKASVITIALDYITTSGANITINFKANLSSEELLVLDQIVEDHIPTPLPENVIPEVKIVGTNKTSNGITKVAVYEPEGGSATIVSHNYCDPCSWYQGSVAVANQAMTSADNLTFESGIPHWIDLEHGRLYDEDNIMLVTSNLYRPIVKVDGTPVTTGFTINYEAGTVTFDSSQAGTVTASFYRADKSWFIIKPSAGKVLTIKAAEIQFTSDMAALASPFMFEAWVNHPSYGMIPVPGTQIVYKNFKDFISACNEGQGLIPALGELTHDVHVFPFHYARPKALKSSQGVEIRVYIKNHTKLSGQFGTATFYVVVDDEIT